MTPLNDDELNALLRRWEAPAAPAGLHARIFSRQAVLKLPGWHWLLNGSFRVPVPVAAALILLVALWAYVQAPQPSQPPPLAPEPVVSLADFRPVERLEPRFVGELK